MELSGAVLLTRHLGYVYKASMKYLLLTSSRIFALAASCFSVVKRRWSSTSIITVSTIRMYCLRQFLIEVYQQLAYFVYLRVSLFKYALYLHDCWDPPQTGLLSVQQRQEQRVPQVHLVPFVIVFGGGDALASPSSSPAACPASQPAPSPLLFQFSPEIWETPSCPRTLRVGYSWSRLAAACACWGWPGSE